MAKPSTRSAKRSGSRVNDHLQRQQPPSGGQSLSAGRDGSVEKRLREFASRETAEQLALTLFEELDTAVSLSCAILLRYKSTDLFRKTVSPRDYEETTPFWSHLVRTQTHIPKSEQFRKDLQAVDFLRKLETDWYISAADRRSAALTSAESAEALCAQTNSQLRSRELSGDRSPSGLRLDAVLHRANEICLQIAGDFNADEWVHSCKFGPGVTSGTKGAWTAPYNKILEKPSFTEEARNIAGVILASHPLWRRAVEVDDISFVSSIEGDVVTTVPKTVLTDRTITVSPGWLTYCQRGVGICLRRRLRRWGVDLLDQFPSQCLAAFGSKTGRVFTLDLSSASDTVSTAIVRRLFRSPLFRADGEVSGVNSWLRVMENLRCQRSKWPDGSWRENSKFSAMGCGFTFELETLIFLAITRAVCNLLQVSTEDVRVYGDDITGPVSVYADVVWALDRCGFIPNPKKSFAETPFRESCGGNFWNGEDVTPVRLTNITTLPSWYSVVNGLRKRGLVKAERYLCKQLARYRLVRKGPRCLGDAVIHSPHVHEWTIRGYHGRDRGYFFWSYRIEVVKFTPSRREFQHYEAGVSHSLLTTSDESASGGFYSARSVGKWRFGEVLVDRESAHAD